MKETYEDLKMEVIVFDTEAIDTDTASVNSLLPDGT